MNKITTFSLILLALTLPISAQIYTPSGIIQGSSANNSVGIGTTAPISKLDIFTGLSGTTVNLATLPSGTISFGNNSTATTPTIYSKSLNSRGLLIQTGTIDGNTATDMEFNIRESSNVDYSTLNKTGFRFTRFGTTLFDVTRNGKIGIGTASNLTTTLLINGEISGATTAYGIMNRPIIQSDVTNIVYYNRTYAQTEAAPFTLTTLIHHYASQGTFGAGSSVTNQYGFFAESTLVGATNNYGFKGNLPIGTSTVNWNAYMGGTAPNYFNGNVLIGTIVPLGNAKETIQSDDIILAFRNTTNGTTVAPISRKVSWFTTAPTECASIDVPDSRGNVNGVPMIFSTKDNTNVLTERMRIANGGNVGIGSANPDSKLTVNGTIHSTEVKVTQTVPADYVFEKYYLGESSLKPDYTMLTLSEVEKFAKTNHHLPNVPSAKEIKENGLHLGEMSNVLLQKIEELTLYAIEQQKTIARLQKENESFKKLEARLDKIELEAKK